MGGRSKGAEGQRVDEQKSATTAPGDAKLKPNPKPEKPMQANPSTRPARVHNKKWKQARDDHGIRGVVQTSRYYRGEKEVVTGTSLDSIRGTSRGTSKGTRCILE